MSGAGGRRGRCAGPRGLAAPAAGAERGGRPQPAGALPGAARRSADPRAAPGRRPSARRGPPRPAPAAGRCRALLRPNFAKSGSSVTGAAAATAAAGGGGSGGGGGGGGGVRAGGGGSSSSIKEPRFLPPWEPCAAVCNVSGTGEGPHRAEEIPRYGECRAGRGGVGRCRGLTPLRRETCRCRGMRASAGPTAAARRAPSQPAGRSAGRRSAWAGPPAPPPPSLPAAGGGAGRRGAALSLHGGARPGPAGSRSLRGL